MPAAVASSNAYWISGLSTTGSISFGMAFVTGRKRVPSPATGNTALRTRFDIELLYHKRPAVVSERIAIDGVRERCPRRRHRAKVCKPYLTVKRLLRRPANVTVSRGARFAEGAQRSHPT